MVSFLATLDWQTHFDSMLGSFGAWAHVPYEMSLFSDQMTYWQRLQNVYYCLWDKYLRHYTYMPQQQELVDKYFDYLKGKQAKYKR